MNSKMSALICINCELKWTIMNILNKWRTSLFKHLRILRFSDCWIYPSSISCCCTEPSAPHKLNAYSPPLCFTHTAEILCKNSWGKKRLQGVFLLVIQNLLEYEKMIIFDVFGTGYHTDLLG